MTYQVTLRNIHAALLLGSSTRRIRDDVIKLMREEAERQERQSESDMVAQKHPLGFFVCKWTLDQDRSLRLHLWSKNFNWAQEPGWEIHDHIFSFSSLLLLGSLRNRVYDLDETPIDTNEYSVYEVLYNGSQSSMKLARAGVELRVRADKTELTGTLYSMDSGILHSSDLVSNTALTVLATSVEATNPIVPRVISAHRSPQLVNFERSPPVASHVANLLMEFAQHLDDTPSFEETNPN